MKVGDLVRCYLRGAPGRGEWVVGVIVSFAEKGHGGKDYVSVMVNGEIHDLMSFDVEVVNERR